MKTMGRLTRIDARSIWPDEAADFTTWLSCSLPAPSFKAMCCPNRLTKGQIALPGERLYLNFWERFAIYLARNNSEVRLTSFRPLTWNHAISPRFR
jgi:hypothetical protein